jgi:hypothetical protein
VLFFTVAALTACQKPAEKPHDNLKLSTSHKTVKEKNIIVPPEVVKRWKSVKLAVIDKTRGTENIYVIPIGTLFKVPHSELSVMVEAFLPAFTMEGTTITTSSNELLNPGAKVNITENGAPVFQGWLFSKFPNTHAVTHPKFGFSLITVIGGSK